MTPLRLAAACLSTCLVLCACGSTAKPQAGSPAVSRAKPAGNGKVDDPRARHLDCLRSLGQPVVQRGASDVLVGTPPNQVTTTFTPTPGSAQEEQITGHVQGAEAIGSALLYPGNAPDDLLSKIESCLAQGVKG